ncbi:MAG: hypothetical protein DBX55_01800 [Verrucomicrobia bacterium]|nr:MAG: hypothetical protein DBX55_01800 [Verrucomicrobiota bacterium]
MRKTKLLAPRTPTKKLLAAPDVPRAEQSARLICKARADIWREREEGTILSNFPHPRKVTFNIPHAAE